MLSSIRQKLTGMYIILIIIPLLIINYLSVENLKESILGEIEVNTLKTANIISNVSRDSLNKSLELRRILYQYAPMLEGRILILNKNRQVMVDSFHLLERRMIDNDEIRQAFQGEEKLGYYLEDKDILQAAVPIIETGGPSKEVIGAVLLSINVEEDLKAIRDFRQQLMMISIAVAMIGVIIAMFASQRLTEPIVSLSLTAKRIGEGHLGKTVNIKSRDEIGRLAENFNYMSRELHRIDRGRTQFIGDVSHELKTPLASIKALVESLIYGEEDIGVYKEYLGDIDGEIDRLSSLVNTLLTLNKIGEMGIEKGVFDLGHLIKEGVRILKPLAEKYGIDVILDLQTPPRLICDGNRIKEVLINLIDNAFKYRDEDKEEKFVLIKGHYRANNYEISIEDNGIGIDKKEIPSIFEKFYRTDSSRSRDTGGAGLGLSIVKDILQLHKWEIDIFSRLNEGTIVTIRVPKDSLKLSL